MLNMPKLGYLLLVVCLLTISNAAFSQCQNSISLKKAKADNAFTGTIEIDVKSGDSFVCSLMTQSGSGSEIIETKRSSGNATIVFASVARDILYKVEVEFQGDGPCKRLQKSLITIE